MHRFILVASTVLLLASCDRFPDNGLQTGGMLPIQQDCTVDPTTDLRRSRGIWDVSYPPTGDTIPRNLVDGYIVTPLLTAQYVSRALEIQAEMNTIQVTNFEVVLQDLSGEDLVLSFPNPYSVPASAVLPAGEDIEESLGTSVSTVIPADRRDEVFAAVDAAGFGDTVIVAMRAVGTTLGGFTNRSDWFFWPVDLCMQCLDICSNPMVPPTQAEVELLAASCAPGQDGFVYCSNPALIPTDG